VAFAADQVANALGCFIASNAKEAGRKSNSEKYPKDADAVDFKE